MLLPADINMIALVRNGVLENPLDSKMEQPYSDIQGDIEEALEEMMNAFDASQDNRKPNRLLSSLCITLHQVGFIYCSHIHHNCLHLMTKK